MSHGVGDLMVVAIALIAVLSALGAASYFHRQRQKEYLLKTLAVDEALASQVASQFGIDGTAVAGATLFDVLYNTMKLDPYALQGMDRLHHAPEFENLGHLMEFMKAEIIKSEPGESAWRPMVHKYKGYAGEEVAIENLRAAGHDVEVPDATNNPGYDVLVDGKRFNVKVTDNPAYIQEHLDRYPDIDVITNREMADAFSDNPRVVIDPELSAQELFHATSDTFEGIADAGNIIDSIPLITLAANVMKNGYKVAKGTVDLRTATEHTVLDTAAVGFGGKFGAKLGLAAGLALAPVTGGASAVIIPAATSLIGSLIGIFAGKGISGFIKGRHLRAAMQRLRALATDFRNEFLRRYGQIVDTADAFFEARIRVAKQKLLEEHPIKRLLFPSLQATFYAMSSKELKAEREKTRSFYEELRSKVMNAEPSEGGMVLYSQGDAVLQGINPLVELYNSITEQMTKVNDEKQKLR